MEERLVDRFANMMTRKGQSGKDGFHEVCVECGEDWKGGQKVCSSCGCNDHESEYWSDTEERRGGGLDRDAKRAQFSPGFGGEYEDDDVQEVDTTPKYSVSVWEERDNINIYLTNVETDKVVASWIDDDARNMFESGYFEASRPGPGMSDRLEQSVFEYAKEMGMIPEDAELVPEG